MSCLIFGSDFSQLAYFTEKCNFSGSDFYKKVKQLLDYLSECRYKQISMQVTHNSLL